MIDSLFVQDAAFTMDVKWWHNTPTLFIIHHKVNKNTLQIKHRNLFISSHRGERKLHSHFLQQQNKIYVFNAKVNANCK